MGKNLYSCVSCAELSCAAPKESVVKPFTIHKNISGQLDGELVHWQHQGHSEIYLSPLHLVILSIYVFIDFVTPFQHLGTSWHVLIEFGFITCLKVSLHIRFFQRL